VLSLLRHGWRIAPRPLVIGIGASVVGGSLMVAQPLLVGQAVGRLPAALTDGLPTALVVIVAAVLVALLLGNVTEVLSEVSRLEIDGRLERDTTQRMGFALSDDPDLSTLDNPQIAGQLQKVRGRSWEIQMGVRLAGGPLLWQVITVVGSAVALSLVLSPWVTLALLVMVALDAEFCRRLVLAEMDVWSGQTEDQKHAQYAFEQGMGRAAKEIRIFGLAGYLRSRYWERITAAYTVFWRIRRRRTARNLAIGGGRALVTAGAIAYAGWQAQQGRLDLTGIATALPLILTIGGADVWSVGQIQRAAGTLRWLDELLAMTRRGGAPPTRSELTWADVGDPPVRLAAAPTIIFDDVTFTYPGTDRSILTDLTLELPSGRATALVGVNGAGKSTLVKLLAGGYLPTRGRILVDGRDLASLDDDERRGWQRQVAPITQDFVRLPLPAGDNVELGTGRLWAGRIGLDSWPDTDRLDAVADRAGIADLVARLPHGWATPLDKTLPDGTDLSGGEWQRIGLARALRAVAAGARVLVLDEPAAALDVQSEARLVDGYLELAQHVTSLVISHRFSVVRPVPMICVLEHGRIVESGSHEDLMAARARYQTMFSLQASRYVERQVDPVAPAEVAR